LLKSLLGCCTRLHESEAREGGRGSLSRRRELGGREREEGGGSGEGGSKEMREEGGRGRREWGGRREEGGGRREEGGGRREEGERFSVQRENEGGWTGEPPSS
jgi:hypothetical protein